MKLIDLNDLALELSKEYSVVPMKVIRAMNKCKDKQKHGEWLYEKNCVFARKCSVCGSKVDVVYANNFCCCCGSMNMKGRQPHEID